MKISEITDKDYRKILLKELDGINDLELLILKGHILIEYSLNKFINDTNESELEIDKANLTFSNKIKVAEFLGLFRRKDHLKENIKEVNKLRNQIAHRLDYDKDLMKKIINRFLKNNIDGSGIEKSKDDKENFYYLIIAICGLIMGKKLGQQRINRFTKKVLIEARTKDPEKFDNEFKNFGIS